MKRNIRTTIICFAAAAVVVSGVSAYMITVKLLKNPVSHTQGNSTQNSSESLEGVKYNNGPIKQADTRREVAASIHMMANMLIVTDDNAVDGYKALTKENLDATVELIKKLPDGAEKNNFLAIITRWRNCDFSHAVEDHNYVWEVLGEGQDKSTLKGRAVKINETVIRPTTNLIKRGDYTKDE